MSPSLEQHERIKMRLRLVGSSLADIARELGVRATTVSSVSQGYRRSRRIEAAIAHKLGLTAERLWEARYPPPSDPEARRYLNLDHMGGARPSPLNC